MMFSRNVAGYKLEDYTAFLDWALAGGSRVVRVQLNSIAMGYTGTGAVDEAWAVQWDRVLDAAQEKGIYVLPVFSSWFDWNAGAGYSTWSSNPLNQAKGGPVKSPAELFRKGSATQEMWMQWMQTLVERWRGRKNILGWEIFSEVNLATGATESSGIDFVDTAAAVIRFSDPGRPVTASIADTGTWRDFYREADIDFIQTHPYPPSARLDRTVVEEVRAYLKKYDRPVLIGESGLNAESPELYPQKAEIGVRHAIWADIVSGAMNARALYWEDSFSLFIPRLGRSWMEKYQTAELPAVGFTKGVDFTGFRPLEALSSKDIWGGAVGSSKSVLGWYRDAGCEPPNYPMLPILSGQSVTVTVPGDALDWKVDFYSTQDGVTLLSSVNVSRLGRTITFVLSDFHDDIAIKATAK